MEPSSAELGSAPPETCMLDFFRPKTLERLDQSDSPALEFKAFVLGCSAARSLLLPLDSLESAKKNAPHAPNTLLCVVTTRFNPCSVVNER